MIKYAFLCLLFLVGCEHPPKKAPAEKNIAIKKKRKSVKDRKTVKDVKPAKNRKPVKNRKAIDTYRRADGSVVVLYDDMTWAFIQRSPFPENVVVLPRPPFEFLPFKGAARAKVLTLKQVSSKANKVTDNAEWFRDNMLSLNQYRLPDIRKDDAGDVPNWVPNYYIGHRVIRGIRQGKWVLLIYGKNYADGRYLAVADANKKKIVRHFDFNNFSLAPRTAPGDGDYVYQSITWAVVEGSSLYVSNAHRTYAKSSFNKNAYITKINMMTGNILWRSQPLVSNSLNFELIGDTIVSGYGFTAEPDYLYLIDKNSGGIYERIRVKSGPDYIIRKGNQLFVRTYNTNYVYSISGL